ASFVIFSPLATPEMETYRLPAGLTQRIVLNTIGYLFRPRPLTIHQPGYADAYIRMFFMGTCKKSSNHSFGSFHNGGRMCLWGRLIIQRINKFAFQICTRSRNGPVR